MAASVFGRSLSGHGRLTLFRTPAPGAHSLDERNPAISTSAEQNPTIISSTCPSFCGALSPLSFCTHPLCHSEERQCLDEESVSPQNRCFANAQHDKRQMFNFATLVASSLHDIACKQSLRMLRSSVRLRLHRMTEQCEIKLFSIHY